MEPSTSHEFDLPLSANYNEVQVEHFVLDLVCEMKAHTFSGSITFFVRGNPSNKLNEKTKAHLKLDCYKLCITECWAFELFPDESKQYINYGSVDCNKLQICNEQLGNYGKLYQRLNGEREKRKLHYDLGKHWLDIKLPDLSDWESTVITVHFRTRPEGPSLMWTKDQDSNQCVFTIGDTFNNRSLFPSQDMPQAMATWHCNVTTTNAHQVVLMTGEAEPAVHFNESKEAVFHYYSSYRMPASTFALAVGAWACSFIDTSTFLGDSDSQAAINCPRRCRVVCPPTMASNSVGLLSKYLPCCFKAVSSVLEPYPFQRLDVLIAPDCFDSLGLACPNLLILSQSLLSADLSLFHRISHEVCHTWFGILLGQKNWTEEWLTEGMCCYLEDVVHAKAMQWKDQETQERNMLKAFLKYKILTAEIEYTPISLQMLRPDGEVASDATQEQSYVKNGINSERSHIHYMKGFFLLKLLENTAGQDSFLSALKTFVVDYKGKLFSSQELLEYFFFHCPKLISSHLTVSQLCEEWLDSPGRPKMLESFPYPIDDNKLYQEVLNQVQLLRTLGGPSRKRKRKEEGESHEDEGPPRQDGVTVTLPRLLPDQLVLLLGLLVDSPEVQISPSAMDALRQTHAIHQANAEVQHAWGELVIQRHCRKWYGDVDTFLHEHRAMGLYLYGELMISERPALQALARRCYGHHLPSMPRGTRQELQEILGMTDAGGVEDGGTEDEDIEKDTANQEEEKRKRQGEGVKVEMMKTKYSNAEAHEDVEIDVVVDEKKMLKNKSIVIKKDECKFRNCAD